ncbi:hypothetical protein [Mucilaginibacter aquatilis]|uniref:Uncharacterized protein n=1 Tax=Mucilaginibacter aquatilis TaxID=1517760 RepID=A0A6I4I5Y9_9SPHI|nr:hypothetical protein [Mucilaginibacter aquatilis]MVN90482.1 hypothetical protein [Mucilaginibacter aquatilis]
MVPLNVLVESLVIGNIYYFINPQINSQEPHPHLYVGDKDDKSAFLICGTSQFEKRKRYFELVGLPYETLVRIRPSEDNKLTTDTYINCNDVQTHDFNSLFTYSKFSFYGTTTKSEQYEVKNGISISVLVEEDDKEIILGQFPDFDL